MSPLLFLTFGVYASIAVLLYSAAILFSSRRGLSILAVYASSVALQPIILYGVIQNYQRDFLVSDKAMLDMGLSFIIFSWIMIGLMLREYWKFRREPISLDVPLKMRRFPIVVILISVSIFIIFRILSPAGRVVSDWGIESLFSEDYYYLRSEMINIGLSSYTRWDLLFTNTIRIALLTVIIIGLYSMLRYRQSRCLSVMLIVVFCFSAKLVDIWIRYEKLHIVVLLVSCMLAVMFSMRKKTATTFEVIRTSTFVVIIGLLLSIVAYMVTEGHDFTNSIIYVFQRIALVPGRATAWYFEIYPRLDDFSWFSTSRTVRWIFDTEHLAPQWSSIAQDVSHIVSGGKFIYDANVALPGDAWANGGYLVVGIASLGIGFIFTKLDDFTMRWSRKTNFRPLPIIYLSFIPAFGNTSISSILTNGIVLVPFIALLCFTVDGNAEARPSRGAGGCRVAATARS